MTKQSDSGSPFPTKKLIFGSGLLIAALIGWRFLVPRGPARFLEILGDDVQDLWSQAYFHLGSVAVTPELLVKAFVFFALLAYGSGLVARIARRRVLDLIPIDEGQRFVWQRGISLTVFLIGLVVGLQSSGVELGSLLVLGGALGVGIGLGLQNIAKNFASGLILLLERPVRVGDRVEVGGLLGDVMHIGGRGTWIRTNDNVMMIIPNSEFTENRVINWTANDRKVRISVPLGVSYSSDPEHVRKTIVSVALDHPDVLSVPAPEAIFRGFGDSALSFELWVWTTKRVGTPKVMSSELYYALFAAFKKEGIEIPFPQRDLHLRSAEPMSIQTVNEPSET